MPATAYISAHNVARARIAHYHPETSRAIDLRLVSERQTAQGEDQWLEVSIFGLPEDIALAMVKALADADTTVCTKGENMTVTDYLVTKGVFDAIEGK